MRRTKTNPLNQSGNRGGREPNLMSQMFSSERMAKRTAKGRRTGGSEC
jgi:hypothetical protein